MIIRKNQAPSLAFRMSMLLILSVLPFTTFSDPAISEDTCTRIPPKEEEIRFANGQIQLGGTLFWPASGATRGAVVVLAGSDRSKRGPLRIRIAKNFARNDITAFVYDIPGTRTFPLQRRSARRVVNWE